MEGHMLSYYVLLEVWGLNTAIIVQWLEYFSGLNIFENIEMQPNGIRIYWNASALKVLKCQLMVFDILKYSLMAGQDP